MPYISRRRFLQISGMAAGVSMIPMPIRWLGRGEANAFSNSIALQKFIQPLRQFGVEIPLAAPDKLTFPGVDYYNVTAGWYRDQLHPALNPTRLYGYGTGTDPLTGQLVNGKHLGHAILATKGTPVRLKLNSALPLRHIIPFDSTIPMPNTGLRQDRAAVHLHGGLVPWTSDGGPFHWISNPANNSVGVPTIGPSQVAWLPDASGVLTDDYWYPNNQSPRFMWYHDHAIGTTRTSAYAGVATGYLILDPTDPVEAELAALGYSPADLLVFQDKIFWNPILDPGYATYVTGAQAGDLWYPYLYERNRWKVNGPSAHAPIPSCIPEFFGDTMLVNGSVYPFKNVNAGAYRIRTLNACNARFLNLKFVLDDGTGEPVGGYLAPAVAPVDVWMIGAEGGFLPAPVQILRNGLPLNPLNLTPLLQAPAERFDLIVDFGKCGAAKIMLYNDAGAPYPVGAPVNDYYPGAPKNPIITAPGTGPNTRTIMRFNVSTAPGMQPFLPTLSSMGKSNPVIATVPDTLNGGLKLAATPGSTITMPSGVPFSYLPTTQEITLNEIFDLQGRLQQLVGTNVPLVKGTFGRTYMDAPTEVATYGSIQIWNFYNLTADVHPMHVHLFNAMILRRRPFQAKAFNGIPNWTGPGRGPDLGEEGWKETFKMWPGECTTIAILVENPLPGRTVTVTNALGGVFTGTLPTSPRLQQSYGVTGDEYVFHCHILEHEEHDMMRPLVAK